MSTMRSVLATAAVAVALGMPAEMAAQRLTVWVLPRGEASRLADGPFATLLNHADTLALSSEQVDDIRAIRSRLAERTERHVAQLRDAEVWGVNEEDTAAVAALDLVRREADEFTHEAEVEVEAVLTEEQRLMAAAILEGGPLAGTRLVALADPPPGSAEADSVEAEIPTLITVENQNYLDVSVYVYRGGQRQRLGSVTGLNTRTFPLPEHLMFGITPLRFQVDPIGRGPSPASEEVMVRPGDEVLVRIPPT